MHSQCMQACPRRGGGLAVGVTGGAWQECWCWRAKMCARGISSLPWCPQQQEVVVAMTWMGSRVERRSEGLMMEMVVVGKRRRRRMGGSSRPLVVPAHFCALQPATFKRQSLQQGGWGTFSLRLYPRLPLLQA